MVSSLYHAQRACRVLNRVQSISNGKQHSAKADSAGVSRRVAQESAPHARDQQQLEAQGYLITHLPVDKTQFVMDEIFFFQV